MTFDLISDDGNSFGTVSETNLFRRKVKSRKYNTLGSFYCIFQIASRVVFF